MITAHNHRKENSLTSDGLQAIKELLWSAKDLEENTLSDYEIHEILKDIEAHIIDIRADMED